MTLPPAIKSRLQEKAAEVLDKHPAEAKAMTAFAANAKIGKLTFDRSTMRIAFTARCGARRIRISIHVPADAELQVQDLLECSDCVLEALLRAFGLKKAWPNLCGIGRGECAAAMRCEIVDRGGRTLFKLALIKLTMFMIDGKPQRAIKARCAQGNLNRATAFLRKARKAGATKKQMILAVRQILAEEAAAEVYAS